MFSVIMEYLDIRSMRQMLFVNKQISSAAEVFMFDTFIKFGCYIVPAHDAGNLIICTIDNSYESPYARVLYLDPETSVAMCSFKNAYSNIETRFSVYMFKSDGKGFGDKGYDNILLGSTKNHDEYIIANRVMFKIRTDDVFRDMLLTRYYLGKEILVRALTKFYLGDNKYMLLYYRDDYDLAKPTGADDHLNIVPEGDKDDDINSELDRIYQRVDDERYNSSHYYVNQRLGYLRKPNTTYDDPSTNPKRNIGKICDLILASTGFRNIATTGELRFDYTGKIIGEYRIEKIIHAEDL